MKRKYLSLFIAITFILSIFTNCAFAAMADPSLVSPVARPKTPYATVVVPVTKTVVEDGTASAPKKTFTFDVYEFGADGEYEISGNTVKTNGAGDYETEIKIDVYSEEDFWNLSEGFMVSEVYEDEENWEYDINEWYVLPGYEGDEVFEGRETAFYNITNGDEPYDSETNYDCITFTNTYTKDEEIIDDPVDITSGNIYELEYVIDNDNSKKEEYPEYSNVKLTYTPIKEGHTFTGWYKDKECTEKITEVYMTSDMRVYAGWEATEIPEMLNGDDHIPYVVGYEDGTVRPKNNITRAEVSMIFYRLLNEDIRNANHTTDNPFDDVPKDEWYNEAISTMAKLGILKGRTPTSFEPDADITRAEYSAICSRFDKTEATGENIFTDINDHWAKDEIIHGVYLGWIKGYSDNTFRPDNNITRAESMTLTNRVLQRIPENTNDLLGGMTVFPDNIESDWYYIAVQEAANGHEYERKENGYEKWTSLK